PRAGAGLPPRAPQPTAAGGGAGQAARTRARRRGRQDSISNTTGNAETAIAGSPLRRPRNGNIVSFGPRTISGAAGSGGGSSGPGMIPGGEASDVIYQVVAAGVIDGGPGRKYLFSGSGRRKSRVFERMESLTGFDASPTRRGLLCANCKIPGIFSYSS